MKNIEEMTQEEIISTKNIKLINEYNNILKTLMTDRISIEIVEKNYGKSIIYILYKIEEEYEKYQSKEFFQGNKVIMYPNKKAIHAKKSITCDFSGGIIMPGSLYISYRPMINNLDTNTAYILKRTLRVEQYFESELPNNIQEFENLYLNMQNDLIDNSGIDYNHLSQRVGGEFIFQKLKRRKYENRNNK